MQHKWRQRYERRLDWEPARKHHMDQQRLAGRGYEKQGARQGCQLHLQRPSEALR